MGKKKLNVSLDKIGLVIVGTGASLFYYYLEESMAQDQSLGSFITIAIILIYICCLRTVVADISKAITIAIRLVLISRKGTVITDVA